MDLLLTEVGHNFHGMQYLLLHAITFLSTVKLLAQLVKPGFQCVHVYTVHVHYSLWQNVLNQNCQPPLLTHLLTIDYTVLWLEPEHCSNGIFKYRSVVCRLPWTQ